MSRATAPCWVIYDNHDVRFAQRYPFRLLEYCLVTNHFHLLLRPKDGQSITLVLQSLTVVHT